MIAIIGDKEYCNKRYSFNKFDNKEGFNDARTIHTNLHTEFARDPGCIETHPTGGNI